MPSIRSRPIADIRDLNHPSAVADPFEAEISTTRRWKLLGFLTLLVVLGGVSFVEYHRRVPAGPMVEGRVVAFGSATWDGTDVPLTVQLQDGTMRHVVAPRTAVAGCKIGSRISLQLGGYVHVAPEGCQPI